MKTGSQTKGYEQSWTQRKAGIQTVWHRGGHEDRKADRREGTEVDIKTGSQTDG